MELKNELKTMKEKIGRLTIIQLALIAGIIILASQGREGWGWLVFLTWCTL